MSPNKICLLAAIITNDCQLAEFIIRILITVNREEIKVNLILSKFHCHRL